MGQQQGPRTNPRGRRGGLAASVPTTDHNDIKFFWILHVRRRDLS